LLLRIRVWIPHIHVQSQVWKRHAPVNPDTGETEVNMFPGMLSSNLARLVSRRSLRVSPLQRSHYHTIKSTSDYLDS
ncbi:hypothetical protein STEG23_010837, partial [Scotinomys teguina]